MSVIVMGHVFKHSAAKGVPRLVLLALADVASDEGDVTAYARGRKVLADKANCDEGSVRRAIESLAKLGEIEVLSKGSGRVASDYKIRVGPLAAPPAEEEPPPPAPDDENEGVQDAPPAGAGSTPTGGTTRALGVHDAPPISPSLSVDDPSSSITTAAQSVDEQFAEFYAAYPRRVDRGHALKSYRAALKKVTAPVLLEAAHRYADSVKGKEARFIAYPATWLNGERWADEPEPAAVGKGHGRQIDNDRGGPTGAVQF